MTGVLAGIFGEVVFGRLGRSRRRASAVALFLLLGCFSLFNVALARSWRWPGRLFLVSLVALFIGSLRGRARVVLLTAALAGARQAAGVVGGSRFDVPG